MRTEPSSFKVFVEFSAKVRKLLLCRYYALVPHLNHLVVRRACVQEQIVRNLPLTKGGLDVAIVLEGDFPLLWLIFHLDSEHIPVTFPAFMRRVLFKKVPIPAAADDSDSGWTTAFACFLSRPQTPASDHWQ